MVVNPIASFVAILGCIAFSIYVSIALRRGKWPLGTSILTASVFGMSFPIWSGAIVSLLRANGLIERGEFLASAALLCSAMTAIYLGVITRSLTVAFAPLVGGVVFAVYAITLGGAAGLMMSYIFWHVVTVAALACWSSEKKRRSQKNLCPECEYDLRGSMSGCPECGWDKGQ